MATRFVTTLFFTIEIPTTEYRSSMSSRSWVRALSASAAIANNRINYAYLISVIQFGISPTHTRLAVADFLILRTIPTLSRYILPDSSRSAPGCPHLLKFHHGISCPHPHTTCVLPQPYILCKIIRLCTYRLIRPPNTYPSTCAVMDYKQSGSVYPLPTVSLLIPFRFPGFIRLLIWVFLCQCITFSLLVSFAAASRL
jgi:hypothetical protein